MATLKTITGHTVPQVSAQGTLTIKTNHPRGFIVLDTVQGTAVRGRRGEFAFRGEEGFRVEDVQAMVQITNRLAAKFGIKGVSVAPVLPTTVTVPGNGVMDIADLDDSALLFAIALEGSKYQGQSGNTYKALVAEKNDRGL